MAHDAASPAGTYSFLHANDCCSPASSRSASPKFNIADFEHHLQLPHSPLTAATARETSYSSSHAAIDDLDFTQTFSGANARAATRYARGISTSFLKRSASKLIPKTVSTANLPVATASADTLSESQPGSGASSPTKSLSSFISANSGTLSSSASKASVRARTASKAIFDNYFNGDSNKVHLGVLPPTHSRNDSVASYSSRTSSSYAREDGYEPDSEAMAATPSYTRSPLRTRPRRSPTTESTTSTYAGKIGTWWNSNKQSSPKAASSASASLAHQDDPLTTLDIQSALFPYGPVDPLNPTSFNDLLSAAEALLSTYQNAYRQRVTEVASLKSETALKQDELEECETRAQHLKMQLQDLGEQCTAQTQRADTMEGLVRERSSAALSGTTECCSCGNSSVDMSPKGEEESRRRTGSRNGAASDSGFESDGDSVFSAHPEQQHDATRTKSMQAPTSSMLVPLETSNLKSPLSPMFTNDLRRENDMLRARVAELEGAVDGCLDMLVNPLAL